MRGRWVASCEPFASGGPCVQAVFPPFLLAAHAGRGAGAARNARNAARNAKPRGIPYLFLVFLVILVI